MKKNISILLLILSILNTLLAGSVFAEPAIKFSDVPDDAWFAADVNELSSKGLVAGYGNGIFGPNNNLTVAECITILVRSLGYKDIQGGKDYWADNFIAKVKDLGIVKEGEYFESPVNFYNKPINRVEMARMFTRALTASGEQDAADYMKYEKVFSDISSLDNESRNNILKLYAKGIVVGYGDGTFGVRKDLKRAEICALVIRLTQKDRRQEVKEPAAVDSAADAQKVTGPDSVYTKIMQMYPDNTFNYNNGPALRIAGDRKPTLYDYDVYFVLDTGIYEIGFKDKNLKESDKPIIKDLLKIILPNDHQKAYDEAFIMMTKSKDEPDHHLTLDGKKCWFARNEGEVVIFIEKIK